MLRTREVGPIPEDTKRLGEAVLREDDPYRRIGECLPELLSDEDFAALYAATGRKAISPALLAMVTLFQFLEDLPDRDAARMVRVRLDWKYALRLPLEDVGFDFTDLHAFRERLLAHRQERAVFERVLGAIRARGLVRRRGKQRTDALGVLGAVRELSRLEMARETLRLAVREAEQADPSWWERTIPAGFSDLYGQPQTDYGLSEAEAHAALARIAQDGFWLLDRIAADAAETVSARPAIATLRTVWAQQFERQGGEVEIGEPTVPTRELIVTPHDVGVRIGEKRGKRWRGEKVHVTESCDDDLPRFLTDVQTTNAASADIEALPDIRQHLATADLQPAEHYVDSGYVSAKQLADSRQMGAELVGPPLPDTSPQAVKLAHFRIDPTAQEAICPAGNHSTRWIPGRGRDGSSLVQIRFAPSTCQAWPLRPSCVRGANGRTLRLSEHYALLAERRRQMADPAFHERLARRAGIEATLSELVRQHAFRRHRYRGDPKRHAENLLKAAACNLKRLVRTLGSGPGAAIKGFPSPRLSPRLHPALLGSTL